jgi:hypothetical protein
MVITGIFLEERLRGTKHDNYSHKLWLQPDCVRMESKEICRKAVCDNRIFLRRGTKRNQMR